MRHIQKHMKFLKSLDDHILKILLSVFIFFIPLYMKFPFHNVNFTYISIRLDDFLAVAIIAVFCIQVLRQKINFKDLPFKVPFAVFWTLVMAAFLSGFFITQTIEYPQIGFLHAARRIQYMMLFFVAFASIRTARDFKFFMYAIVGSIFLSAVYGMGQRLFAFPAISTMNPEFAKGRILYLTPEARLSSTFAGHYDFGAFLVFLFPLMWALFFQTKQAVFSIKQRILLACAAFLPLVLNVTTLAQTAFQTDILNLISIIFTSKLFTLILGSTTLATLIYVTVRGKTQKWFIFTVISLSVIALISTSSRSSSIAYVLSISAFLLMHKKFKYFIFAVVLFLGLSYVDSDLIQRWAQTIQFKEIIINSKTGEEVVVQKIRPDQLPAGTAFVRKQKVDDSTASAYVKQELIDQATSSGKMRTASGEGLTTGEDYETYSAVAGDISVTTRLQVSWPRAVNAFLRNPLLGTGPSSITESTDGDYFRWIGEIGALGAASFVFLIGAILKYVFDKRNSLSPDMNRLVFALIFGTWGLLINAVLIDVFEASKVAYIFWLTLGLFVGMVGLEKKEISKL